MSRRYFHFTNIKDALDIRDSGVLWKASFGPAGSVFAIAEGSSWVPNVQMSSLGRAKSKSAVVVFETKYLPDKAFPEEVIWHMDSLPIHVVDIISPAKAKHLLNNSIPVDKEMDMLKIPLHPVFGIWGEWTRMPEDFQSWTPGKDNETYFAARELWQEDQDINLMRSLWNDGDADKSQ